jgi:hypothetical protein
MKGSAPSLVALVVRRIVVFAAFAMLAQFLGVFAEYWSDDQNLGRLAIERETGALSQGVSWQGDKATFSLPAGLRERYASADRGYYLRVRTSDGAVLFSNCDTACVTHFLPLDLKPLTFWMRQLRPGKPLNLAGGAFSPGSLSRS